MFLQNQDEKSKNLYIQLLKAVGSLSRLNTDSKIPYLYYRSAENIFCKAFNADNLSRSDCSVDARFGDIGIGLKTFIYGNGNSYQKVAEFNKDRNLIEGYKNDSRKFVLKISELRNKRLVFTENTYGLRSSVYHCVGRVEDKFCLFEEEMHKIDINNIIKIQKSKTGIAFNDGINDYNFNFSKSTLFKRFTNTENLAFDVKILEDPFNYILKMLGDLNNKEQYETKYQQIVCLPLYSKNKIVQLKSGLNQWNGSRFNRKKNTYKTRNRYECYIPVDSWFNKQFPDFFPPKDQKFNLHLPNKTIISAKICQDGNKALMSDPNSALGEWLFDTVLKTKEGEIITYVKLQELGIDSVEIRKIDIDNYEIDFMPTDSFEEFKKGFEKF
jgi:hypothetical protein